MYHPKIPKTDALVVATGEKLKVYKLQVGTPTTMHIWADASPFNLNNPNPFGSRTFTETELQFSFNN